MALETRSVGESSPLPGRLFAAVYLRSLALQASWNAQRMQNVGLATSLLPWLSWQQEGREGRRRFLRRYYGFFNTNPYFANFLIGGLLRLETDGRRTGDADRRQIAPFCDSLARALASLGDQLFWLGIRPALLIVICMLALAGWTYAVLAVVGIFGLGQLELRRRSLIVGYRRGFDLVDLVGDRRWHRAIAWSKRIGIVLTGVVIGVYFARVLAFTALREIGTGMVCLAAGIILPLILRKRIPGESLLILAALLFMVVGSLVS